MDTPGDPLITYSYMRRSLTTVTQTFEGFGHSPNSTSSRLVHLVNIPSNLARPGYGPSAPYDSTSRGQEGSNFAQCPAPPENLTAANSEAQYQYHGYRLPVVYQVSSRHVNGLDVMEVKKDARVQRGKKGGA